MAQPTAYNRNEDFTQRPGDETNHTALNAEFDAAAQSINQIRANLALLQADSGELKPGVVGPDQLSQAARDSLIPDVAQATADAQAAASSAVASATAANSANAAAQAAKSGAETAASAAQANANAAAGYAAQANTENLLRKDLHLSELTDKNAARNEIGAAKSGAITGSGLTLSASVRLVGRSSAGGGAIEEIQIGGGLSLSGGVLTAPAPPSGVTSFNTRTGAVTLTSSDVTVALGFTPYNSASIGSASVNYAASAGNANTLQGYVAGSFAPASHTHSYAPMTAVVAISDYIPETTNTPRRCVCTRADGSTFSFNISSAIGSAPS